MSNPEFGALLTNLLENAIEACQKVEPSKREIIVLAQSDEDGIRMEVSNRVSGTVSFDNGFPKSNKVGGGTGTKSIAHIVHKYEGMLRFKQDKDTFITQIVLPF